MLAEYTRSLSINAIFQNYSEGKMEPIAAFATVVGLLSVFKREIKDTKAQNAQAFLSWLGDHRHQEIRDAISNSDHLTSELDRLLHEDHVQIMAKLDGLDELLARIASRMGCFREVAWILRPGAELSEQAMYFLRCLVASEAKEIARMAHIGGLDLQLVPSGGEIVVYERRLVDDDLTTLVNMQLLRHRKGAQGTDFYGITRNAIVFVRRIDAERERKSPDAVQ